MSASNYLELKLLDHLFGKGAYTPPSIYVALLTAEPSDTDEGDDLVEAAYTGYARKSTAAADWRAAVGGATTNANKITFAPCTGLTASITHWALVDSGTTGAGNVLVWGALTSPLAISNGITPEFAVDALSVSVD
jgi:hypothetical protein